MITLSNKTLVVTGGTGSFGNAVVNRFINTDIGEIRIFSRDEKKQEDMRHLLNDSRVKFYIGDVRDYDSVREVTAGADLIFHAAALKQVPSCEFYPMEAVRTNVLGAENVLKASVANQVSRVVVLSTDKAVYPINAMGLSKAMMEKLTVARARTLHGSKTVMSATRYGNVMASRGSVIPLFIRQIKEGRPLTVTDPSMTRFMMSLAESVDLVLHAYENSEQGDIFVQKAPASTVGDVALALCRLFNVEPNIRVIGTRHGEKLFETLVSREEMVRAEDVGQFYRIPADARDLNYQRFVSQGEAEISRSEDFTSHNTRRLTLDETVELLAGLDYVQHELRTKTLQSEGV
jgi:UDP-N-acetylglucosamine 4,6-dehydratase/5-epimerase